MLHMSSSASCPKTSGMGSFSRNVHGTSDLRGPPYVYAHLPVVGSTLAALMLKPRWNTHVRVASSQPHVVQPGSHFFGGRAGSPSTPFVCVQVQRSPSSCNTLKYGFGKS